MYTPICYMLLDQKLHHPISFAMLESKYHHFQQMILSMYKKLHQLNSIPSILHYQYNPYMIHQHIDLAV